MVTRTYPNPEMAKYPAASRTARWIFEPIFFFHPEKHPFQDASNPHQINSLTKVLLSILRLTWRVAGEAKR
jgi:hypothetical protein